MTNITLIAFSLSVRICGSLITESCHWEKAGEFTSEHFCHIAGRVMSIYPLIFGYKCRIETHPYQYRTGTGNPF